MIEAQPLDVRACEIPNRGFGRFMLFASSCQAIAGLTSLEWGRMSSSSGHEPYPSPDLPLSFGVAIILAFAFMAFAISTMLQGAPCSRSAVDRLRLRVASCLIAVVGAALFLATLFWGGQASDDFGIRPFLGMIVGVTFSFMAAAAWGSDDE